MKLATEKQINFIESLERQTGANLFEIAREIGAYYTGDLLDLNRRAASEIIDILLEIKKLRNFAVVGETTTEDSVEAETVKATEENATTTEPVEEKTAKKLIRRLGNLKKPARAKLSLIVSPAEYQRLLDPQTREAHVLMLTEAHALEILAKTA